MNLDSNFSNFNEKEQEEIVFKNVFEGNYSFFEQLLKNNINFSNFQFNGNFLIHEIAKNGDSKLFNLIKDKIDINSINKEGKTALHFAVQNNHILMIQKLLKNGAKIIPDNEKLTPLDYADKLKLNNIKILLEQFLLYKENDQNSVNFDIFDAIKEDQKDFILNEINQNKNFYIRNKDGLTPLHYAVQMGDIEIVKLLLQTLNVNVLDSNLNTALQTAFDQSQNSIGEYLISQGGITFNENDQKHQNNNENKNEQNVNDIPETIIPETADLPTIINEQIDEYDDYNEISDSKTVQETENGSSKIEKEKKQKEKITINIFKAIQEQNAKQVYLYCKRKGNLLLTDENGKLPLYIALKTENYKIIKPLCTLESIQEL